MERIDFLVQGSAEDPYRVSFLREDGVLMVLCTCEAGINGMHCKHRTRILSGSDEDVTGALRENIATAASWAVGTSIASALTECIKLETEAEEVKRKLQSVKKRLAAAMMGR